MKTTLYLPDDLKRAVELVASRRGTSEAEVIRQAIRNGLPHDAPKPKGGVFAGDDAIADRVDELLAGFGE